MNKNIITFLVFVLTCLCAACQPKNVYLKKVENDWKQRQLKGRVKKMIETLTDTAGLFESLSISEYNEQGFLVHDVDSSIHDTYPAINSRRYKYDFYENSTCITHIENGTEMDEFVYKYDAKGNLLEVTRGKLSKDVYTYDEKNRTKEELCFVSGNLSEKKNWEYNPDGRIICVVYDMRTKQKTSESISTNSSTIKSFFDQNGKQGMSFVDKKNKSGQEVYSEMWENGKLAYYTKILYNKFNDEYTRITFYNDTKKTDTVTRVLTYDTTGNWISAADRDHIIKRQITYW